MVRWTWTLPSLLVLAPNENYARKQGNSSSVVRRVRSISGVYDDWNGVRLDSACAAEIPQREYRSQNVSRGELVGRGVHRSGLSLHAYTGRTAYGHLREETHVHSLCSAVRRQLVAENNYQVADDTVRAEAAGRFRSRLRVHSGTGIHRRDNGTQRARETVQHSIHHVVHRDPFRVLRRSVPVVRCVSLVLCIRPDIVFRLFPGVTGIALLSNYQRTGRESRPGVGLVSWYVGVERRRRATHDKGAHTRGKDEQKVVDDHIHRRSVPQVYIRDHCDSVFNVSERSDHCVRVFYANIFQNGRLDPESRSLYHNNRLCICTDDVCHSFRCRQIRQEAADVGVSGRLFPKQPAHRSLLLYVRRKFGSPELYSVRDHRTLRRFSFSGFGTSDGHISRGTVSLRYPWRCFRLHGHRVHRVFFDLSEVIHYYLSHLWVVRQLLSVRFLRRFGRRHVVPTFARNQRKNVSRNTQRDERPVRYVRVTGSERRVRTGNLHSCRLIVVSDSTNTDI